MGAKQLIESDEALRVVLNATPPPNKVLRSLEQAAGATLAESVVAPRADPPFARAMMDGFAVRHSDAGRRVRVVTTIAAGSFWDGELSDGSAAEIMTGAPCPAGSELVVPVEEVVCLGEWVQLPEHLQPGRHQQDVGALCQAGAEVLSAGLRLTPLAIGTAVSLGLQNVWVFEPPVVAIISTGSELRPAGTALARAQIHDSNGPMLEAWSRSLGVRDVRRIRVEDDLESLAEALERVREVAVVAFTGGASAGRWDLVPEAIHRAGAELLFQGVNQKPGKPVLCARRGVQLVFGLPGTPLGCHAGFHRYVASAIRRLSGRDGAPSLMKGTLTAALESTSDRPVFRLARVRSGGSGGGWEVEPLRSAGSMDLFGPVTANAYVPLPPGRVDLPAGAPVPFELCEDDGRAAPR